MIFSKVGARNHLCAFKGSRKARVMRFSPRPTVMRSESSSRYCFSEIIPMRMPSGARACMESDKKLKDASWIRVDGVEDARRKEGNPRAPFPLLGFALFAFR